MAVQKKLTAVLQFVSGNYKCVLTSRFRSKGKGLVVDAISIADDFSHPPLLSVCTLWPSFHEGQTGL